MNELAQPDRGDKSISLHIKRTSICKPFCLETVWFEGRRSSSFGLVFAMNGITMLLRKLLISAALSTVGLGIAGCDSNAGNGALIGGATGAGLGAIIGHNSHGNTAGGAVIGGAVGAVSGALIGGAIDQQQAQQRAYDGYPPGSVVVASEAPPPPAYEVVPPSPYPAAVWINGYWIRQPHGWVWVNGYWR